jgi:hypothetical protein
MVAVQPDLRQVVKSPVFGNLIGRQVTVVINDRHPGGMVMVQPPGSVGLKEKIVGEKRLHRFRGIEGNVQCSIFNDHFEWLRDSFF